MATKPTASANRPDYLAEFTPPWAVTCWCDDTFVYCMIPALNGPPLIQKFALNEGGLSKAINILKVQRRTISKGRVHKESAPVIKHIRPRTLSAKQEDKAKAILRKMGLI